MGKDKLNIDDEIQRVLFQLSEVNPCTDDYQSLLKSLDSLTKTKETPSKNVSLLVTLMGCLTNLAGIGLMLNTERMGVISSKVLGSIFKPKI